MTGTAEVVDRFGALSLLPDWLSSALNGDLVRSALSADLPECQVGLLLLLGCVVKRLVLDGHSGQWVGTYRFTVRRGDSGPPQTVELVGTVTAPGRDPADAEASTARPGFADPGWRWWLPALRLQLRRGPDVPVTTDVAALVDAEQSRLLAAEVLRAAPDFAPGLQVGTCVPRVLGDKPGNRSVVRYDLELVDGSGRTRSDSLIVKSYRKEKGRTAYGGMLALWDALRDAGAVAVARPLAYFGDRRLLVQAVLPGDRTLEEFLGSVVEQGSPQELRAADEVVRASARALAALHGSPVRPDRTVSLAERIGEAAALMDRLTAAVAPLTPCAPLEPLLARVEAQAADSAPGPLVPSHGAFHPEQVLLTEDGHGHGLVDFDDFCLAEPGMDIGMFLAALADLALSTGETLPDSRRECFARLDRSAALADTFLDEYERHAPVSRTRVLLWQTVDHLVHAARTWTKVKAGGPAKDLLVLEHHLARTGW